jgi:hypothetical protein
VDPEVANTPLEGESAEPLSLSEDDATALILGQLDDDPAAEAAPEGEGNGDPESQAEGDKPKAETKATPDAAKGDDEDPEVILRDNTKVKLSDLKRIAGDAAGEQARFQQAVQAKVAEFQQQEARIAQQEQLFQSFLPILQQQVPPPPNPAQWDEDPIGAIQQERAHNEAVGRLRAMQGAMAQRQQQHQQKTQAQMREHLAREHEGLMRDLPELKDEKGRTEFLGKMMATLKDAEFSEAEANQVSDRRIFKILKKAIAYDDLMAQKPVAQKKVQAAVPVQAPARRVMPAEAEASAKTDAFQKLRKSGRPDDAVAAIKALL